MTMMWGLMSADVELIYEGQGFTQLMNSEAKSQIPAAAFRIQRAAADRVLAGRPGNTGQIWVGRKCLNTFTPVKLADAMQQPYRLGRDLLDLACP